MPNTGPYYLTIGDFNRDGNLDIISANNGNNTVGVLLGTGTGTFGTRPLLPGRRRRHLRQCRQISMATIEST